MKAAAIILCLVVCVSAHARAVAAPSLSKYSGADAGHLLVSAALWPHSALRLRVKRLDAPGEAEFVINSTTLKNVHYLDERPPQIPDGFFTPTEEDGRGYVLDFPLPPGRYELDRAEAIIIDGILKITSVFPRDRLGPGVTFDISPGQVAFLGRLHTVHLMRKGGLGLPSYVGAHLTYSEEKGKDLALASARYPQLAGVMATARSIGPVSFGP